MKVICKNVACKKIIDDREKDLHLKIYHPNFMSLVNTTSSYPEIKRFLTPKELVEKLFEVI